MEIFYFLLQAPSDFDRIEYKAIRYYLFLTKGKVRQVPSQTAPQKTIRTQLLEAMRTGPYADAAHLPPETELALTLGISRTQLRDALAVLEQEGFITRRHGVGTLINRHVLKVPVRMDIEEELLDMIRSSGYDAALAYVHTRDTVPDADMLQRVDLPPDTPILRIDRLYTANGRPAIFCVDLIDKSIIRTNYTQQDLEKPIFHFLQHVCGISAYMDLTDLRPVIADESLARLLDVPTGAPLLQMYEVDYDISGELAFCSLQYFVDGYFNHTVLRKKL